ncbi:MAG: 4Fe-4S dicluster domain-containing protein [Actinobacteria bacterium]|nr:4Fe-4S dicluster domain-containing protein [Actinomycetota bacterium]
MAIRANPKLITELEIYGAQDVSKCYHCGNCSATCPFSKEPYIFPRRSMRSLQMGLEAKLESDLEPWLCYYCGECSTECPRDAQPGETMMSLRRWLTARYDFTGIARLFYKSAKAEILAVILVALLTAAGFLLYGFSQGSITQYDGPNAFLPASSVHIFDWTLAAVLLILLGTNCTRMWWFTVGRDKKVHVPFSAYVKKIYLLPMHFFTQMRYAQCEQKRPWVIHLVLMLSYVTMLVLIMFFLESMWSGPAVNWSVHVFGLAATAGLLATTIILLRKRLKKTEVQYEQSHETDWMFLVLLIVVAATGIVQFTLHRLGLDTAANVNYVIHMMAVVPMLLLEVPFSKWSHMAYRPLAMYFADLKAEEMVSKEREAVGAPQAA